MMRGRLRLMMLVLPVAMTGCVAPKSPAATDGYTPINASQNDDLKRYLPKGVSAATLLLSADTCYYYQQGGKILPVRTEAGRYCIG